jgi:ubiquinone biosynthesis UbiH/UbiF/VisC/COQ6 family hydroxylase
VPSAGQDDEFDVIVVGAGLVGLALARALRGAGLRLALVDRGARSAALPAQPEGWDQRVYAISPGSEAFLAGQDAWPGSARVARVTAMQVRGDAGGHIAFDAQEARTTHLASIVEGRVLLDALWQGLGGADLALVMPAQSIDLQFDGRARLTLEDGRVLLGRLVVAADGASSWVRAQAGIPAQVSPYGQTAVVANFSCERAHAGAAFQWFRRDGVLALLPLAGNRCSLVWSAQEDLASELLTLTPQALAERVREASGNVLGELEVITPAAGFPLQLVKVDELVRHRLALVGDAAHNLHPLAGQGVNLGFQDARELADVLRGRGACTDVGEHRLLRRYERARREDIVAMTWATDGLKKLFGADSRPLSWLRNRGLTLVHGAAPLKRRLVAHALGQF